MSLYLLDTNICVHALKNEFGIKQKIAEVGTRSCFLSEINVAELLFGIENSAPERRQRNRQHFEEFQSIFTTHSTHWADSSRISAPKSDSTPGGSNGR